MSYNHETMLDWIAETLATKCGVSQDMPLIVAVSGGPDSLCLLHCLWRLKLPIIAVHLDHQLRAESALEAELVEMIADQMHIPAVQKRADVAKYAAEIHLSIEEAARILRYQFLFDVAQQHGAQAVVTGHTADDQVETLLMHLIRGSGPNGLQGMPYRLLPNPWSERIALVRPMLGIWRKEILEYLNENGLAPAIDVSNQDMHYFRNRIRHELIPLLDDYNPGFRQRLLHTARIIAEDFNALEPVIDEAWNVCLLKEESNYLRFKLDALQRQPAAIQRYLFLRSARKLNPYNVETDYPSLERAISFTNQPSRSGKIDWFAGLTLQILAGELWIAKQGVSIAAELTTYPQYTKKDATPICISGYTEIGENWRLEATPVHDIHAARDKAETNEDPYQAWIDLGMVQDDLLVRRRQAGDKIQLLGMSGHSSKVSDLMINLKIPEPARANWPVLISGDQIVWIPGLRLSELFKLNRESESAVYLRLVNLKPGQSQPF